MTIAIPVTVQGYRVGGRVYVPRLGVPNLWERRDVRRALAAHDFSSLFRIMRSHGISQRKIAAALECAQSEVSEIMAGRRVTSYPVLVRYAEGLQVPRSWLGLAHDDDTLSFLD